MGLTYIGLYVFFTGVMEKKEDTLVSYLKENKNNLVYSTQDVTGQKAITHYEVIKENAQFSLLKVKIDTGRKNQIRVHMQSIGHPVVGDRKYGHGNESSPIDRLCLHARVLEFIHPMTEKKVRFEAPMPKEFTRVVH